MGLKHLWLMTAFAAIQASVLLFAGCAGHASIANASATSETTGQRSSRGALAALFDDIVEWDEARSPLAALYDGRHPDSIEPLQLETYERELEQARAWQIRLRDLSDHELSNRQQLSVKVMAFKLQDVVDRLEFGAQFIPMSAEGGFYSDLGFALARAPFNTASDYEDFIAWLPDYARYLDSHIALLAEGVRRGQVGPQPVVRNNLQILAPLAAADFSTHPHMAPFRKMPEGIAPAERERLRKLGGEAFTDSVQGAYQRLEQYLATEYLAASPAVPGVFKQSQGRAYYANRVQFFATLPLSADQVFALGEREVERIGEAMDAVLKELGFAGSRIEFIEQLRGAPEHYPESGEELLAQAAWISKQIEGRLPRFFEPLYSLPFTIEPVPLTIAATYTSGRYLSGDAEQDRPGVYWVNTTRLDSRALFNLPALTLHEAVPGHHLQHARAEELTDVHAFRRDYYISAFGEGWGLYAEYLGEEMGIYQTPYERFGRLSYEMWRACRLVVDVGLHDRGWSREQAIDYLGSRTALSELEVVNEIDRYIGWPGQALAYKLGELTIKALRREAEQQLGENFSIKAFHEAVLGNGSLPLTLLASQVRAELGLRSAGLPAGLLPE